MAAGRHPLSSWLIIRLTWLAGHGGAWQRHRRQAIVRKHAPDGPRPSPKAAFRPLPVGFCDPAIALILEEFPMSDAVKVGFVPLSTAPRGVLIVFCDEALKFGPATRKALGETAGTVKRAAAANQFKGKNGSILDILAPDGMKIQRLIVIGSGKGSGLKETDFLKFGGLIAGKLNAA